MVPGARPAHMVLLKNLTLPDPPEDIEPDQPTAEPIKQTQQQQQQQQPQTAQQQGRDEIFL